MARRSNWRDKQEWQRSGLLFTTPSDSACKLFDAAVTQYVGFYEDLMLGGLATTLNKLLEADPNAVMGHVINLGLEIIGSGQSPKTDASFRKRLETLTELSRQANVNDWERLHVNAIQLMADGHILAACDVYEEILVDYPCDILAIKFVFDLYIYTGSMPERRNCIARVLPHWDSQVPLYSYLYGLYCFSLCETNEFDKAEMYGKMALALNPTDSWATHSMVHTYEMTGRFDAGTHLLESTVDQWRLQESLACHNYWHWAIQGVEKGDYEGALGIFDSELLPRTTITHSGFNVSDCSALLKRLEIQGVSAGNRWQNLYEICRGDLATPNNFCFTDVHNMMCVVGAQKMEAAKKMLKEINEFTSCGASYSHIVKREVGASVCESLLAYGEGEIERAVDILYPLRYQIYRIGGSNAQRDVFHQFLIHAALQSPSTRHNKIARCLLAERKAQIENSALTDRLMTLTLCSQ